MNLRYPGEDFVFEINFTDSEGNTPLYDDLTFTIEIEDERGVRVGKYQKGTGITQNGQGIKLEVLSADSEKLYCYDWTAIIVVQGGTDQISTGAFTDIIKEKIITVCEDHTYLPLNIQLNYSVTGNLPSGFNYDLNFDL